LKPTKRYVLRRYATREQNEREQG